jgi:putative MATE family efflux protein
MGVAGVAWATIIAQGGAFITAIIYLNKTHEVIKFNLRAFQFHKDIFAKCIRIGLPTGIQHTFISLGMTALMSIVNGFGTNVIAAYTIAVRIDSLALLPAMNFAQALSTFVGQNIGAGKNERIKKGLKATLGYSLIISLSVTALVVLFSDPILGLFTKDQAVIDVGKTYLHIVTSFYFLFSVMFAFNGVLRGAGATIIPMFISLFSLWVVRIPLAWWLSDAIGYKGIWWAIPIAWTSGVIITFIYYLSGKWKNKAVVSKRVLVTE